MFRYFSFRFSHYLPLRCLFLVVLDSELLSVYILQFLVTLQTIVTYCFVIHIANKFLLFFCLWPQLFWYFRFFYAIFVLASSQLSVLMQHSTVSTAALLMFPINNHQLECPILFFYNALFLISYPYIACLACETLQWGRICVYVQLKKIEHSD